MSTHKADDGSKKVKNIAAVVYLAVLIFLVGGSYINQQRADAGQQTPAETAKP
jgi:hypothetical protein